MDFKQEFESYIKVAKELERRQTLLKENIFKAINEIADEHKKCVNQISEHIFTIKLSQFFESGCLSPEYYDWRKSAEYVIGYLEKSSDVMQYKSKLVSLLNQKGKVVFIETKMQIRHVVYTETITTKHPICREFVEKIVELL